MSDAVPADVVTTLFVGGVANRPMRFWAYESVRMAAEFRQGGPHGPLIDVAGVSFAFLAPDATEAISPDGVAVRVGLGTYACAIVPRLPGSWQAIVRCTSPVGSVDVKAFTVAALPAGTPPPPATLLTDDSGLFLLLSPDGFYLSV